MLARGLFIAALGLLLFGGMAFASSGGGEHGAAEPRGWVATDTYRVINFAILFAGLFFVLRKPAAKALNARIEGIKEQLESLELQKKAAEAQLAQYNEKLAELDKEAEKIVAEYIRQGNEARARILREAEATAEKLEQQARRNIENEFARARITLQQEVVENALSKAEEMIRQSIGNEDQDRLVDEYLEKVVA